MNVLVERIIDFGVSEKTVVLILMIPVVATFIALTRQIIGIRGFGIYITSIAAFSFVETELKYGNEVSCRENKNFIPAEDGNCFNRCFFCRVFDVSFGKLF